MQRGHPAVVVGKFEHIFAVVGVVLDRDADDIGKLVRHCRFLIVFFVMPLNGDGVSVYRDAFKAAFLFLFLKAAIGAKDLKSRTAPAIALPKSIQKSCPFLRLDALIIVITLFSPDLIRLSDIAAVSANTLAFGRDLFDLFVVFP